MAGRTGRSGGETAAENEAGPETEQSENRVKKEHEIISEARGRYRKMPPRGLFFSDRGT